MISICIPNYRYDPGPLLRALLVQVDALSVPVEVRLLDDGSPENRRPDPTALPQHPAFYFDQLPENVGRAAARNRLARAARYPYLLFLDSDTLPNPNLLTNYLTAIQEATPTELLVLVGGHDYQPEPPEDPARYLHWYYGTTREAQPASTRARAPFHAFHSSNFLVSASLIRDLHPFDEELEGYGHEDTLWGQLLAFPELIDLRNLHDGSPTTTPLVTPVHLDNPVRHLGIDTAETFLRKQERATRNLVALRGKYPDQYLRTRLTDFADRHSLYFLSRTFPTKLMRRILLRTPPPPGALYLLDALKLRWYYAELDLRVSAYATGHPRSIHRDP